MKILLCLKYVFFAVIVLLTWHFVSGPVYAKDDGPILTNPDWTPPANRDRYPGYKIMEDARENSPSWKYSTNRPGGKIKGGGTVKYRDYRSVTRQTRPESGGGTGKPAKK